MHCSSLLGYRFALIGVGVVLILNWNKNCLIYGSNLIQVGWVRHLWWVQLSWIFFFNSTMVGWIKKTLQLNLCTPLAALMYAYSSVLSKCLHHPANWKFKNWWMFGRYYNQHHNQAATRRTFKLVVKVTYWCVRVKRSLAEEFKRMKVSWGKDNKFY